jgi:hypothetical protein
MEFSYRKMISDFCIDLEIMMAHNLGREAGPNVTFTLEVKPASYYTPDIPLIQPIREGDMLFAEVWIGQVCTFREFMEVGCDVEELCRKLLYNIFCQGMAESYEMVTMIKGKS